jgi:thiamine biosynthesis lipoprotein ApbE
VSVRDPGPAGGSLATVRLKDRSLSGSAQPPGRPHIIDPRQGRPAAGNLAAYAAAGPAGVAAGAPATLTDCLSTAFLVMSPDEVKAYCQMHPQVSAIVVVKDAGDSSGRRVVRFGQWE